MVSYIEVKKILYVTLFLLFCCNRTLAEVSARRVYVSSTNGSDFNSGLSSQAPLKTIKKALMVADTVYLKAGDVFYEGGLQLYGKMLSRFGYGSNPTISGYKRIVKPEWKKVDNHIWKLSLVEDNFTGVVLYAPSISNNICSFHDYENDLIHGRKVRYKSEMIKDWDFWQTETLKNAEPVEYNDIYLYYSSDPNFMKLELSIYDAALLVSRSTLDGIDFEGFGFGISAKTKTVIRNCKVDGMGGRIIPEGQSYNCYGNGIEFFVGGVEDIENCIVENCYVTRCYDSGITIQGTGGTSATPRNIIIKDNLITECCQGWEDFLRNNSEVVYENCVFENNKILNSGNSTGWGYSPSRFKYCHILGNNIKGDKGMIIRNNTFVGGNYYCSGAYQGVYKSNVWEGNTCIIKRGDFIIGNYFGTKDVIRIPTEKGPFQSLKEATDSAIRHYRDLTGDKTTKFVIKKEERINRQIKKMKNKSTRR